MTTNYEPKEEWLDRVLELGDESITQLKKFPELTPHIGRAILYLVSDQASDYIKDCPHKYKLLEILLNIFINPTEDSTHPEVKVYPPEFHKRHVTITIRIQKDCADQIDRLKGLIRDWWMLPCHIEITFFST